MIQDKITPLMQQYFAIKQEYDDALVFFQVGDFYELFFDDAIKASSFLAIALTKRGKNQGKDIPLCGVPVHSLNHYLKKLIAGGFKVAICDQLTKPQPGTVVQRGVTQVLTPGTLTDSAMLDEKSASYLMSFFPGEHAWGMVFSELLTAQLFATSVPAGAHKMIEAELIRFFPDEVILSQGNRIKPFNVYFKKLGYCASFAPYQIEEITDDIYGPLAGTGWFEQQFNAKTQQQLLEKKELAHSLDVLYRYLNKNQAASLSQFKSVNFYQPDDYVILDHATQKNLEIIENNQDGSRKNSLFAVMDHAKTAMGSRTLKKWLQRPLVQKDAIVQRQEVIVNLINNISTMQKTENFLSQLADLERIIGRIALRKASLHDYLALKNSLGITPDIKDLLTTLTKSSLALAIADKIYDFDDLVNLLEKSLNEDTSNTYAIKKGFDHQLDHFRNLIENGQQEILKLERQEIERTGIGSLKIRYNNISGYYLEITNPNLSQVPADYIYQQKLVNRVRFTTPELQNLERDINTAQSEIDVVQADVYQRIKNEVEKQLTQLRHTAQALAYLDSLFGLAECAYNNHYVVPQFNDHHDIIINGGRHPVVETTREGAFVKNNTVLNDEQSLLIITGPNMGGKSTYLRQVALICIMAQCGSLVPADSASLPLLDRIFTRIGSGDNVAEGKSTFLVEMEETATICTQATKNSLVILDEVGRGTSTFDGIALAQAIIEYLMQHVGAKCLFATHYHELTTLASQFSAIKNYSMQCKKIGSRLHFLHTIEPGIAHSSFGLDVARLAQLPQSIIERAGNIQQDLRMHTTGTAQLLTQEPCTCQHAPQASHATDNLLNKIKTINMNELTPKQAFDLLWDLTKNV
ncbi:DNA mismatch repair protein MutS [Candidatus Babeliales bacterium]|nr:DNA mismatch repair protein MutS [Candidatus Babeliales bacterium]